MDAAPWFMVHPQDRQLRSNDDMVDEMVRSGSLTLEACIQAFKHVDRQHFWTSEGARYAYTDTPLRNGRLHLSAPHIYAKALESLMPLRQGMSFLNIGSGTGYFNSIVAELTGPLATNQGVEVWEDTVRHAEKCVGALQKSHIQFQVGNIYHLDVNLSSRYDRIYLGACANSKSKYLYRLLQVGGILIGPFQMGHSQQLRRVVRISETQFKVEILGSVQFASLLEPEAPRHAPIGAHPMASIPASDIEEEVDDDDEDEGVPVTLPSVFAFGPRGRRGTDSSSSTSSRDQSGMQQLSDEGGPLGLPGIPFNFSLVERPWAMERSGFYPSSFRKVVMMGLLCRPKDIKVAFLPADIWLNHVLPWCGRNWFEATLQDDSKCLSRASTDNLEKECEKVAKKSSDSDDSREAGRRRLDSEDVSTCAPSSQRLSAQDTPASLPGEWPELGSLTSLDLNTCDESDMGASSSMEETVSRPLYEVFGNGRRHIIGAGQDPDDMQDDSHRFAPLQVLHALMRTNRNSTAATGTGRRRPREDSDVVVDDDSDDDEEEPEIAFSDSDAPMLPADEGDAGEAEVEMEIEMEEQEEDDGQASEMTI